jgi:glycosyltransferase involved in cell wall biosynthesis
MKLSVVVCTRNRAVQLVKCLNKLALVEPERNDIELIVVDNGSTDDTADVIERAAKTSPFMFHHHFEPKKGVSHARNCGVLNCSGELIFFTDDDCYLEPGFFSKFEQAVHSSGFAFGGGQILPHSADLDQRVAQMTVEKLCQIPPEMSVVPPGFIQGASMFFMRDIFEKTGLFNVELGAGTPFPCEDIEMVARAARAGFVGGQLPGFTVYHDHGRIRNSPEALETIHGYKRGSGAYYAELMLSGNESAWPFWWNKTYVQNHLPPVHKLRTLGIEMQAAAEYLEARLSFDESSQPTGAVVPRMGLQAGHAIRVHVFVIAWHGVESNARHIAQSLDGLADSLTVIYSTRDGQSLTGPGKWEQVPNEEYFGKKFQRVIDAFQGDVCLLVHADAFHDSWADVLEKCRTAFVERRAQLGVWAPDVDHKAVPTQVARLLFLDKHGQCAVTQTDCVVCAFGSPVMDRLKQLDFSQNNLGWGIDWAAIAYAYTHHLLVVVDQTLTVKHAPGRGYASEEAQRQMVSFLKQLTPQEQLTYRLLESYNQRKRG